MRPGLLLGIVISVLLTSQILFGQKDGVAPKLNVKQQFDSEISNLKKNLKKTSKSGQKPQSNFRTPFHRETPQKNLKKSSKSVEVWKVLAKSEKDIEILRKRHPIQMDSDEIYMDLVTDSLKQIPRGHEFHRNQCDQYRTGIRAAYDPKSEAKAAPPIEETLEILEILCSR